MVPLCGSNFGNEYGSSSTASGCAGESGEPTGKPQLNWTTAKRTLLGVWLSLILAFGIVVVPGGKGGARVSQTSSTRSSPIGSGELNERAFSSSADPAGREQPKDEGTLEIYRAAVSAGMAARPAVHS